jgi:cytochrome c2
MKKLIKIFLIVILLFFAGMISYVKYFLPNVGPAEDITIEPTDERIARGKYLANSVSVCMDCHSTRDWTKFSGPLVEGTLGIGGEEFSQKFGFPGKFISKNITPFALGNWTDGEILRAITTGVNKDEKALFPVMPHPNYGQMDQEDIYSIIAYVRSLESIESNPEASIADFPMSLIINTIPQKASFTSIPEKSNVLAYGGYLINAAACADCHTQQDKGKKIAGLELAGGFKFPLPTGGVVSSSNITPDLETGIGSWTEEAFVAKFKTYADSSYIPHTIQNGDFNSVMPWTMYATMNEEDLRAIFTYLKAQPAIQNKVERFVGI